MYLGNWSIRELQKLVIIGHEIMIVEQIFVQVCPWLERSNNFGGRGSTVGGKLVLNRKWHSGSYM